METKLIAGEYEATDSFRAIAKHTCVARPDGTLVAVTGPAGDDESAAFALLCAAAPELLEACRLLMQAEGMQQGERSGYVMGTISIAIDAARAAIAKAVT